MERTDPVNRRLAAALSGAALMFALTACGDGGRAEKLEAWSKTVCDSVKPQVQGARAALNDIAEVKQGEKPGALKSRLSEDIDALRRSNSELAEDIAAAGAPPVDDGKKLQQDAVKELRGSAKAYGDLKKQVDELDTKDRAQFAEGLEGVGDEIEKLSTRNDKALLKLQSGDVGRSMAKQAGCKPGSRTPAAPGASSAPSGSSGSSGSSGDADSSSGRKAGSKGSKGQGRTKTTR